MTQEQIEKAAIELCTSEKQEEWLKDYGINCFLDGARWRINSVWHPISEEPGYKNIYWCISGPEISHHGLQVLIFFRCLRGLR